MFNLFKLPFRTRRLYREDGQSSDDIAFSILHNYIRRKKNLTPKEIDRACEMVEKELNSLRKKIDESDKSVYDLMSEFMQKIDKELDKPS